MRRCLLLLAVSLGVAISCAPRRSPSPAPPPTVQQRVGATTVEVKPWVVPEPGRLDWALDKNSRGRAAGAIVDSVTREPLSRSWRTWLRKRPYGGRCEPYRAESFVFDGNLQELWVYRCSEESFGGIRETYAYVLGESAKPTIERQRWHFE